MKPGGYIALYRSVFDNPVLDGEYSRREAWIWLCSSAAWEPTIHRIARSSIAVGRGEIAATYRSLMKQWGWPLGRVQRFLKTLRRERMITLALVDSKTDSILYARCMVIRLCNYNKFALAETGKQSRPIQRPIREKQQTLGFVYRLGAEESNNSESYLESQGHQKQAKRFRTGQKSKDKQAVFVAEDHPQFVELAEDARSVLGFYPAIKDGGCWFWVTGEANRPRTSDVIQFKPRAAPG